MTSKWVTIICLTNLGQPFDIKMEMLESTRIIEERSPHNTPPQTNTPPLHDQFNGNPSLSTKPMLTQT